MQHFITKDNNKRQKISNPGKFNNYAAQNYVNNNLNITHELCSMINTYLFDEQKAKQEWKNKMAMTLSIIDKRYFMVPLYYFHNYIGNTKHKLIPCTECYINKLITNKNDTFSCITCELFQIQNGRYAGEVLINIDDYKYFDKICKGTPKITRILICSNKFMAENVLTISSGIITTKLTKFNINYEIQYKQPILKKIN